MENEKLGKIVGYIMLVLFICYMVAGVFNNYGVLKTVCRTNGDEPEHFFATSCSEKPFQIMHCEKNDYIRYKNQDYEWFKIPKGSIK